jgi:hypothetical protein
MSEPDLNGSCMGRAIEDDEPDVFKSINVPDLFLVRWLQIF